jgi:hypothetical protein
MIYFITIDLIMDKIQKIMMNKIYNYLIQGY